MIEEADEQYEISIFDIISLYPYCNFEGPYPIGHPDLICPDEKNVEWTKPEDMIYNGKELKGLLKVCVIPPRDLYFPVLPLRGDNGRLLFLLCHVCAREYNNCNKVVEYKCEHSDNERHINLKIFSFFK